MKKKKKKKTEDENYIPKAFRKDKKEQKKKGNKSKEDKEKKINKKTITIISIICILIVIILGIYLGISTHRWKTLAKEMAAFQNSTVIDSDGKEIAKLGCSKKNKPIKRQKIFSGNNGKFRTLTRPHRIQYLRRRDENRGCG